MPKVNFTYALKRFFPGIETTEVDGASIRELLDALEVHYPGLSGYVVDDQGVLRQHVNIFLNGELIKDRDRLSDAVKTGDDVYIMQALSGGVSGRLVGW